MTVLARAACNICGNRDFGDTFGSIGSLFIRKGVRCTHCNSLERHRLIFEILQKGDLLRDGADVLHIAPEPCLVEIFRARFGDRYVCGDKYPKAGGGPEVIELDVCRDLDRFAPGSFDIVIHNHVLEHVACDYSGVLKSLENLVRPGGYHIFSVPFLPGGFREDLDSRDSAYRAANFGQWDHMRVFSPEDVHTTLGKSVSLPEKYDATSRIEPSRLRAICIPEDEWHGYNNNSVFFIRKTHREPTAEEKQTEASPPFNKQNTDASSPAILRQAVPRILFVSANGIGQGHLTRQLAIARRLPLQSSSFLTMSYSAAIVKEAGYLVHRVPHHDATGEEPTAWNRHLELELELLVKALRADVIVYDVNFVFDGVIAFLKQREYLRSVWIRRAMWPQHHQPYLGAAVHFSTVVEPGDLAESEDTGPTVALRSKTLHVSPVLFLEPDERYTRGQAREMLGLPENAVVVLLELSGSPNPDFVSVRNLVLQALLVRPEVYIVETVSSLSGRSHAPSTSPRYRQIKLYPQFKYSRAWDAAIVRCGYNTFHENLLGGVPTLFVPDEALDMDTQLVRAIWAKSNGLALLTRTVDNEETRLAAIDQLLQPKFHGTPTITSGTLTWKGGPWRNGADEIAQFLRGF